VKTSPDPSAHRPPDDLAQMRYSRQILFEKIGVQGQRRLLASRVVLIGCGGLGTVLADTLVRAGVGHLRICDRDFIERDNLQRQILFDEADVAANLPKAQAAAEKLARINSEVSVEPIVVDVTHANIERLARNADLLLDGTDNFETRFLINDLAVKTHRPWIYGAVVGATGLSMVVIPHDTPCLRCVYDKAPPPEMSPTCDTAGVLGPAVSVVASLQAIEAIKLLTGQASQINRHLVSVDLWSGRIININIQSATDTGECPCCGLRDFSYLAGKHAGSAISLCGRNAVQVTSRALESVDLEAIARRLEPVASGTVRCNRFLLKAEVEGCELTLFRDGRAIIKGTQDADRARTLYARYFGM